MPRELIPSGYDATLEKLAGDALVGLGGVVYGCGLSDHHGIGRFLQAAAVGELVAILGWTVTEESVTDYSGDARAALGQIYQKAPAVYVDDQLSVEWAAHYAIAEAKLGTNPAWAAPQDTIDKLTKILLPPKQLAGAPLVTPQKVATIGMAILCALTDTEMVLEVVSPGIRQNAMLNGKPNVYHPLVRWAARYGVEVGVPVKVEPEVVDAARDSAARLLELLKVSAPADADAALDSVLGGTQASPRKGRRLEIGSTFDPATHYTAEYYDGRGIQFMKPDGTWATYYGTALHWEGFAFVAETLKTILGHVPGRVLDVGCSAGNFVGHALVQGWDVWGIDLSAEAAAHARPDVRPRLIVGDVTEPNEALRSRAPFRLITTWDLMEHIYADQLPEFVRSLYDLLEPGGILWNTICTRGKSESDWTITPGSKVTQQTSWLLVSGHVTIRRHPWWVKLFRDHGFVVRHDLAALFQVAVAEDDVFVQNRSWGPRNIVVVQRPTEPPR